MTKDILLYLPEDQRANALLLQRQLEIQKEKPILVSGVAVENVAGINMYRTEVDKQSFTEISFSRLYRSLNAHNGGKDLRVIGTVRQNDVTKEIEAKGCEEYESLVPALWGLIALKA